MNIVSKLVERLHRWRFQEAVQGLLETPPLPRGRNDFTALTMVNHRDVVPYLLAIKTFCHFAQPGRVVLVADPTFTPGDRELVARHVPGIELVDAVSFRRPALPVGGCWERLSAISVLARESSVVQLDADTVTFAPPDEVVRAAVEGRSFILRSEAGVEIVDLGRAAETGRRLLSASRHVQVVSEAALDGLADQPGLRYVRGCAGFTGFGRGCLDPERLQALSARMRGAVGERWDEWGSEQVMSNLLAASSPGAFMLPHPKYCNADSLGSSTVLAHYIGYARHTSGDYTRRARQAHRMLVAAGA